MAALTGIELVYQLVQDDVRRPDLQDKIWRRIHRAALTWHRADEWKRDFIETVYNFDVEDTAVPNQIPPVTGANALFLNWAGQVQSTINVQVLQLDQLPEFRKIGYLRKYITVTPYGTAVYDPTTGQQGTVQGGDLTERGVDSMFDGYGFDKTNVFYRSGNAINISSSTPLNKVYIGYFKDPKLTLGCTTQAEFETYDSWIIDNYSDLIVADVKAKMFSDTGKVEEANAIKRPGTGDLYIQEMRLRASETRVALR